MARRAAVVLTPAYSAYNTSPPPHGKDLDTVRRWMSTELLRVTGAVPRLSVKTVTKKYTALPADGVILADATNVDPTTGLDITLPDPARSKFMKVTVKRINSNAVAVVLIATIDGVSNPVLTTQYAGMTVISDGTAWYVASRP